MIGDWFIILLIIQYAFSFLTSSHGSRIRPYESKEAIGHVAMLNWSRKTPEHIVEIGNMAFETNIWTTQKEHTINESLESFHEKLISYMHDTYFDHETFEHMRDFLLDWFEVIQSTARENLVPDTKLWSRLCYIESMFYSIGFFSEQLSHYEDSNIPGSDFVWEVIQLNIKSFSLRTIDNLLVASLEEGRLNSCSSFKLQLHELREGFKKLVSVSPVIRMSFEYHYAQAEATLKDMGASYE